MSASFAAALVALSLAFAGAAQAAFPGANGKIAFTSDRDVLNLEVYAMNADGSAEWNLSQNADSDSEPSWSPAGNRIAFSSFRDANDEIYVMNTDGTAQTRLTSDAYSDTTPAWSPDGQKIAFTRDTGSFDLDIWVMSSDGSSQTQLTSDPGLDTGAAWSPDGQKIAFTSTRDGDSEVFMMNTDGSNQVALTSNTATDSGADFSPNGQQIAFSSTRDGNAEIYSMNSDGSAQTRLTHNSQGDFGPVFSPDGSRIAFRSRRDGNWEIYAMDADGTDQTRLTTDPALDTDPDWQPAQIPGFPRPTGATPLRVALVPAYEECTSPNRTHGGGLAYPSCNPHSQASDNLTLGTPDANGQAARSLASVRLGVRVGDLATSADEADVRLVVSITDIRNASDLSDYTGELRALFELRITDKDNSANPQAGLYNHPATVSDLTIAQTLLAAATPGDPGIGSSATATTTFDAIVPGVVREGRRTIWELGQVQVFDGGADGDAETSADNTLFMVQGAFVP
jgi:WD40 repeat protein